MDFVTLFKQKILNYGAICISLNKDGSYTFSDKGGVDCSEQFLSQLGDDLLLPTHEKSLSFDFSISSLASFRKLLIEDFIREIPAIEELDSVFHSFLKHLPADDFFQSMPQPRKHNHFNISNHEPQIIYLLNQDFTDKKFESNSFLRMLQFKFTVDDNNYEELRVALYNFVEKHISVAFSNPSVDLSNVFDSDEKRKTKFELSIYTRITQLLKPHDALSFSSFWPTIAINKNLSGEMFIEMDERDKVDARIVAIEDKGSLLCFNYGYFSHNQPPHIHRFDADAICVFLSYTINRELGDYLHSTLVKHCDNYSIFSLQLLKTVKKENIPEIFELITDAIIESNQVRNVHLKESSLQTFETFCNLLIKRVQCLSLNSTLLSHSDVPRPRANINKI